MPEGINRNNPSFRSSVSTSSASSSSSSSSIVRDEKKMLDTAEHVKELSLPFGAGRVPSVEKKTPNPEQARSTDDLFQRKIV